MVGTFTLSRGLVRLCGERNVFGHDSFDLRCHFLDLRMGQGLNAEVVIFLKLILDNVTATVEGGNNILVKNLIA